MAVVVGCLPGFCKDWGPLACQTLMELWHKGCIPQHQACCKEAEGVFIHYKNVPFSLSSFRQNKQEQNPVCFSSSWGTVPFQNLIFWLAAQCFDCTTPILGTSFLCSSVLFSPSAVPCHWLAPALCVHRLCCILMYVVPSKIISVGVPAAAMIQPTLLAASRAVICVSALYLCIL